MLTHNVNKDIKAEELRVIDEQGKNLGILKVKEAYALAEEKGLDLVLIAPQATPPVARIISFDKFRYQEEKEARKKQKKQKGKEMKHVRITPRAAKNDLVMKVKQAEKFLEAGHRLEVNLFLRGREKANKRFGLEKLNAFLEMLEVPFDVTLSPRYSGRGYTTQIVKKQ